MSEGTVQAIIIFVFAPMITIFLILSSMKCEGNRAAYRTECFKETQKQECWTL